MFKTGLECLAGPYKGLIKELLNVLKKVLRDDLVSLVIFGSVARGEMKSDSDIDVLIIAKNLPFSRSKRVKIFEVAENSLERYMEELYEKGIFTYFSPIILTPEEAMKIPPIFLDMVEDAIIVYDKNNFFRNILRKLIAKLKELGAERVKIGKKWYWRLKKDYKLGEVIIIE